MFIVFYTLIELSIPKKVIGIWYEYGKFNHLTI